MGQWLAELFLGHIKQFSTELFLKKKIYFLHNLLQKSFQNFLKLLFLYIFYFLQLKKKEKSNSLVTI